jgi:predicted dehydrogenase
MTKPLRVGVIGLGRRWRRRYQPALRALPDRFQVRAVYDQVEQRALAEARRLGCAAASGLTELVERDDVEAVLLLESQWFGLWPVELACRAGKPVFCCAALDLDAEHAEAVCRKVREKNLPVLVELAPPLAPATARLRELFDTRLGPPRLLVCDAVGPATSGQEHRASGVGLALLDWCASLLGGEPAKVAVVDVAGLASVLLEFPGGRAARVSRWHAPGARRGVRLRVVAEKGLATVDLPDRVGWTEADGRHTHRVCGPQPLGQVLLERFHRTVTEGQAAEPGLDDALRALRWLHGTLPAVKGE